MSVRFHLDSPIFGLTTALLIGLLAAVAAEACGPFFPNQMLVGGDNTLLAAPVGDFRLEIARLKPQTPPQFRAVLPRPGQSALEQSAAADEADLKEAIAAARLPAATRDRLLDGQRAVRRALMQFVQTTGQWKEKSPDPQRRGPHPVLQTPDPPEDLPAEFNLYTRGLIAYQSGDLVGARQHFTTLLELKPERRRYRSTWAAFMLAKSFLDSEPGKAIPWFEKVRDLARDGYRDSLGLAAASLGWQGRAELKRGHYDRAIGLYLDQLSSGDDTAVMSLRLVVVKAFADKPEVLVSLAQHAPSRSVIMAYVVAGGGPRQSEPQLPEAALIHRWLVALDRAGAVDVAGADRLAWAHYQTGDMALAQRWVHKAPKDSAIAQWIQSKLLIREGKLDEAAAVLSRVCRLFPKDEAWQDVPNDSTGNSIDYSISPAAQAMAELGAIRLARRQYTDALDCLLRANYWADAAYVAERVLTPDELMAYVNRQWPADRISDGEQGQRIRGLVDGRAVDLGPSYTQALRNLLARRLTRMGRWKEARPYFAADLQAQLDGYVAAIRAGHDAANSAEQRAESLWLAARLARHHGMELLATELGPDSAQYGGNYPDSASAELQKQRAQGKLTGASPDEMARIGRHAPQPEKRWHYRYTAAEHAWSAAALMPDQSDAKAKVLCTAGSWIKSQDPQAADRFYKALVRRCGNTNLGREAEERRWFPKIEDPPP